MDAIHLIQLFRSGGVKGRWLDPRGAPNLTGGLYALHDAVVMPMPGAAMAPSLAQSLSTSSDGLVYDFVLRKGAKFHDGEPVIAEDVKFSFERYRAIFANTLKGRKRSWPPSALAPSPQL